MKSAPQFAYYFLFGLFWSLNDKIIQIFNISYTIGLNIMETYLRGNGLVV
jgi:hypothetical protein